MRVRVLIFPIFWAFSLPMSTSPDLDNGVDKLFILNESARARLKYGAVLVRSVDNFFLFVSLFVRF